LEVVMMNAGNVDRIVRIFVGLALISLVFVGPRTPWGLVGLVLVGTGALGFCPLYRVFGITTCPAKRT
jgi:Na+/proline symporter